jgi:hypothetical protein
LLLLLLLLLLLSLPLLLLLLLLVWYGFLSEIRTRTKALKGKKGVGPEQNLRAPGGRGGGKEGAD